MIIRLKWYKNIIVISMILLIGIISGCNNSVESPTTTDTTSQNTLSTKTSINNTISPPTMVTKEKYADYISECDTPVGAISPDASWAVTNCTHNNETGMYVWKIGEQKSIRLFQLNMPVYAFPYFSPDGTKLLVVIENEPWWLFEVGKWQTPKKLLSASKVHAGPTWSPDSQSIAVTDLEEGWALSILKLDGTFRHLIPYREGNNEISNPAWSPDSMKIAYMITVDMLAPHTLELSLVDVGTGNYDLVYTKEDGEYLYNRLKWSPDGRYILLINDDILNQDDLFLYDVKDNNIIVLSEFGNTFTAIWSPDSQYFCIEDKDTTDVYLFSIVTNEYYLLGSFSRPLLWIDDKSIIIQQQDKNFYLISWK